MVKLPKGINWNVLLRIALSAVMLLFLFNSIDSKQGLKALTTISYPWLLASAGITILAVVISVQKWRVILITQGIRVSWKELWNAYWVGLFFNNFLPSSIGGDAMRIHRISKQSGDLPGVTASVVIERLLATAGIALVGGLAGFFATGPRLEVQLVFGSLLALCLGLISLLVLPTTPRFLEPNHPQSVEGGVKLFWQKGLAILGDIYRKGKLLKENPRAILRVILWSVLFQITVVAVNYSIFQGLHLTSLSLLDLLYLIPATSIAAMLPLGINGYGLREGAYIGLLLPYGVAPEKALAASLLFALVISLLSLWGGLIWLRTAEKEDATYDGLESSL